MTAPVPPRAGVRRSRSGAVLGGVCAGIARSAGLDPLLLRIALVAVTVLTSRPLGFGRPGLTVSRLRTTGFELEDTVRTDGAAGVGAGTGVGGLGAGLPGGAGAGVVGVGGGAGGGGGGGTGAGAGATPFSVVPKICAQKTWPDVLRAAPDPIAAKLGFSMFAR